MAERIMKCESLMNKDGTVNLDKIIFPKLVSAKLDGNRSYNEGGSQLSSSGKPVRNLFIRETCSIAPLHGLDCEIVVGPPTAENVRRRTSSEVGRAWGEPDFKLYVFDDMQCKAGFETRLMSAERFTFFDRVVMVPHFPVYNISQLLLAEERILKEGYEGIILRDPNAPYKFGRSTLKQNWALKLKRFIDAEAEVVGYEELMHNDNPAELNEHGYTQRSSHKENLRPGNMLGALLCRDIKTGVEFKVGTGWSMEERAELWAIRETLKGRLLTYKHFPIGAKDKPNLPGFVAWRDADDMTD